MWKSLKSQQIQKVWQTQTLANQKRRLACKTDEKKAKCKNAENSKPDANTY